jgi:hypothetical protein
MAKQQPLREQQQPLLWLLGVSADESSDARDVLDAVNAQLRKRMFTPCTAGTARGLCTSQGTFVVPPWPLGVIDVRHDLETAQWLLHNGGLLVRVEQSNRPVVREPALPWHAVLVLLPSDDDSKRQETLRKQVRRLVVERFDIDQ